MLTNLITKNRSGFTLVELLIVVAIVGILATVGIPGYQRMVQKSRQSEAKVNLGNVALVESTFFSEYGAYGINLLAMGFEADNEATMRYRIGFGNGACANFANVPTIPTTIATCTSPDQYSVAICQGNQDYYGGQYKPQFGRLTRTLCGNGAAGNTAVAVPPAANPWATYTAVAAGTIAPGESLDTPAGLDCSNGTAVCNDAWSIDQTKTLLNVQSGIK